MNRAASRTNFAGRRFLGARFAIFAALVAAFIGAYFFRDFAVDDALISVRYARNLANGAGWRFNADPTSPPSDGVTPLVWPLLLAPFAVVSKGAAWSTFVAARTIGQAAHAAATVLLLRAIAAAKPTKNIWTIVILSLLFALPTSAYASSGMETSIAELLATMGVLAPFLPMDARFRHRPETTAVLVGCAAVYRPELAPWAMVVAFGLDRRARSLVIAIAPPALCAAVRAIAFGSPAPLALMAKPSDLAHGVSYAATAIAISIAPLLLFAPRALLASTSPSSFEAVVADGSKGPNASRAATGIAWARVLAAAFVVHAMVVAFVGGDWMPFARLFAPVLPSTLYAFVRLAPYASRFWTNVRAAIALVLAAGGAYAGRGYLHLMPERIALANAAKPLLANAHKVASVDIGWPTLATEADFVDLAGLTDPAIAALPGGHTSKRVDPVFLWNRGPDIVLLYTDGGDASELAEWTSFRYPRAVEARLVGDLRFTKRVEPIGFLPIGSSAYVVLRVPP